MIDDLEDPLAMFEAVKAAQDAGAKTAARFQRLTRELFATPKGREWLTLAMAKHNFMGSVFSAEDGMNPGTASFRDGVRSLFSDILNTAAAAKPKKVDTSDE